MAIYEQKTDSREFEIANQGAQPNPNPESVKDRTDIIIRLWGLQGYGQPASMTWKTDSICIYMIADIVSASRGSVDESAEWMAAHFESAGQALVAAKRIQKSILEFLSGRPGEAVGAAILIQQPFARGGFNDELLRSTFGCSRPGQILIPQDLSQRWNDLPGMEFRAIEGGIGNTGLVELVWTAPEQLARLQISIPPEPPPVKSPDMAATMIVSSPFQKSPREANPALDATADFVFRDTPPSPRPVVNPQSSLQPQDSADAAGKSLLQELDELENRPFFTRGRVIVGVIGLVLVAAVIALVYWPMPNSKPTVRMPETTVGEPKTPVANTPAANHHVEPPPIPPPAAESKPAEPTKKTPKPAAKPAPSVPQPDTTAKNKSETKKESTEPPPPPVDVSGWSRKDIPQLLRMAQSAAGNGRYDDARIAYLKILQLQPDNQDAKEGLRRINLIKGSGENQ